MGVCGAYTQQFDYDFRNRIAVFTSNGLGSMAFEYDRWGNRTKQCGAGGAPTMNPTLGTNNRATARRDPGGRQASLPVAAASEGPRGAGIQGKCERLSARCE